MICSEILSLLEEEDINLYFLVNDDSDFTNFKYLNKMIDTTSQINLTSLGYFVNIYNNFINRNISNLIHFLLNNHKIL